MKYFVVNQEDQREYEEYKNIRGEPLYEFVAQYCCQELQQDKVDYQLVREIIKYDKRIKDNLYKFLGTLEDYLKTQIYSTTVYLNEKDKFQRKEISIEWREEEYFSTFAEINTKGKYFFSDLIKIAQANQLIDESINWKQIKNFRNKVMHFNFLLFGHDKKGQDFNLQTLKKDILLLKKALPKNYGSSLVADINQAKKVQKWMTNQDDQFFLEEIK